MDRENAQGVVLQDLGSVGLDRVSAETQGAFHPAPPSTVLVTGASGFLGSAIAAALRAGGHAIRVLARPSSPRTNLNVADVVCEGDLRDRASLAAALKGARYLFHAAADYRLWARDPQEIRRGNVEGTRLIMEEALSAGVERIVYTSSVATLKLTDGALSTENNPLADGEGIGVYKRSKVSAERLVEAMIQRDGLPAVIVNPSTPVGPRDVRPTPTGRIIVEAASGRMPAFVDTGLNLAHVDDVAAGHIAALERGENRRALHSWRRQRPPRRYACRHRAAGWATTAYRQAAADHALSTRLRKRRCWRDCVTSNPSSQWMACGWRATICSLTISKARRELGYASRPYVEGLADAIAWFRAHGHLK